MNIEQIKRRLPNEIGKPELVSGILLEREQDLDSTRINTRIVILTDRSLRRDSGPARSGMDDIDMNNIRQALRGALMVDRKIGYVFSFVVRERRLYPAGSYERV